jgi:hypothetical protein
VPLSKKILFENLTDCDITVDIDNDQAVFTTNAAVTGKLDNDNIIRLHNEITGPR